MLSVPLRHARSKAAGGRDINLSFVKARRRNSSLLTDLAASMLA
jgi:hypothetical protein